MFVHVRFFFQLERITYFLDMDRSHVVAQASFHFAEVYHLFKVLGLRHLPVVDEKFQVVGMITRHDLLSWNFDH